MACNKNLPIERFRFGIYNYHLNNVHTHTDTKHISKCKKENCIFDSLLIAVLFESSLAQIKSFFMALRDGKHKL